MDEDASSPGAAWVAFGPIAGTVALATDSEGVLGVFPEGDDSADTQLGEAVTMMNGRDGSGTFDGDTAPDLVVGDAVSSEAYVLFGTYVGGF